MFYWEHYIADRWGCSVPELEDRITYPEFRHWIAFYVLKSKRENKSARRAGG